VWSTIPIFFRFYLICPKLFKNKKTLKKWNTYSQINEAYDNSEPNQNIKPVLIKREHVDKKIESKIVWKYGIISDLYGGFFMGQSFLTGNTTGVTGFWTPHEG